MATATNASVDTISTSSRGRAVGIDLGTTNSVVAYVDDQGNPQVIPSAEGGRTVPSVFAITEIGDTLVGRPAVDQEGDNPENTVRSVKRHMGTTTRLTVGGQEFSPEQISAAILAKLKADAERTLGVAVGQAVITVPAYFNDNQRKATILAGELAGLHVLQVINEPTAAALAYGMGSRKDQTVLVYDLGGGTFDVTVLKINKTGIFEVKATAGDTCLGGDDLDGEVETLIYNAMMTSYPALTTGAVYTPEQRSRLRTAAEQAKRELSAGTAASVSLPYFAFDAGGRPINVKVAVHRRDFERVIQPWLDRTKRCVDQALRDAQMTTGDIDEIIFVGGSTRVPLVAEQVQKWISRKPNCSVNPDEAVGVGAAIQAAQLSGETSADVLLLDVIPLSLGIEVAGGDMNTMIARNTTIPVEYSQMFSTAEDGQTQVDVRVYQGERPRCADNLRLGEFHFSGLEAAPRGVPEIEVTFSVDHNAILSVSAKDKRTGQEHTVTISGQASLTGEEIERMVRAAAENAEADKKYKVKSDLRALLLDEIIQTECLLRDSRAALTEETVDDLEDLLKSMHHARDGERTDIMQAVAQQGDEAIKEATKQVQSHAAAQVEGKAA